MNKLTIPEAAQRAGVSRQTVWLWCRLNGIGERFGRVWMVDPKKLSEHLKGKS